MMNLMSAPTVSNAYETTKKIAVSNKGIIPLPEENSKNLERANLAAQDFEAVYLSEMLKPMFETVEVDDMFGGGKGEEIFRGFFVQELGKSIAKQGGLGLSDQVKAELLKIQEQQSSV